jgi:tRNA-specific 2-thiouridylase
LADYRDYFNTDVISPYIATYKRGETPNPCNICNRVGKTKYLFDEMQRAGCDKIATGHYAKIIEHHGRKVLAMADGDEKDQSYYLSLMEPFHVGLMIYPLSFVQAKADIRTFAARQGLPVASKRDSYEACFLMGEDYRDYIFRKVGEGRQGHFFLDELDLGAHRGTFHYTVGQRRGLDISHTEPLYVKHINPRSGDIALTTKRELYLRGVRLRDCIFDKDEPVLQRVMGRLRHKMKVAPCTLEIQLGGTAVLLFDEPQWAPAPGQVTTVYDGSRVIGGGVVDSVF